MTEYQKRLRSIVSGEPRLRSARHLSETAAEFGKTPRELEVDLARTRERLSKLDVAIFCCTAPACCRRRCPFPEVAGVPVLETACLGPCKRGPVVKLKVHDQEQYFAGVDHADKAQAVIAFGRRAQARGSLMVDPGEAQVLLFDPHHPGGRPAELDRLNFLAGRFRGQGTLLETGETFLKEVEGRWESGQRFLSIRQRASYGDDVHSALIVVGENRATAYRDDGSARNYFPKWDGDSLLFDDSLPHRVHALRARKRITPTDKGYTETLEITRDGTTYSPYYIVNNLRLEATYARL